jgi:hypothetical protein
MLAHRDVKEANLEDHAVIEKGGLLRARYRLGRFGIGEQFNAAAKPEKDSRRSSLGNVLIAGHVVIGSHPGSTSVSNLLNRPVNTKQPERSRLNRAVSA